MINAIIELLKKDEGLKLKPYKCSAGKLTIGVGRNIEDNGISEDEAEYLLRNDIDRCYSELSQIFNDIYEMPESVQLVLVSMCFNLGLPRFILFKKTIQYVKNGDYKKAAVEMLDSKWAGQVKDRAKRLSNLMYDAEV